MSICQNTLYNGVRVTIFDVEYCVNNIVGAKSALVARDPVADEKVECFSTMEPRGHETKPFLISIAKKFKHETKSPSKNFSIAKVSNVY